MTHTQSYEYIALFTALTAGTLVITPTWSHFTVNVEGFRLVRLDNIDSAVCLRFVEQLAAVCGQLWKTLMINELPNYPKALHSLMGSYSGTQHTNSLTICIQARVSCQIFKQIRNVRVWIYGLINCILIVVIAHLQKSVFKSIIKKKLYTLSDFILLHAQQNAQKPADIWTHRMFCQTEVYLVLQIFNLDFLGVKLIVLFPYSIQKVDNCFFLSFNHLLKMTS